MTVYNLAIGVNSERDLDLIKKLLENMKGVIYTHFTKTQELVDSKTSDTWFENLEATRRNFDASYIDLEDDRTQYILSK